MFASLFVYAVVCPFARFSFVRSFFVYSLFVLCSFARWVYSLARFSFVCFVC